MGKYRFTQEATRDLYRIWRYTYKKWSVEQADYYFDQLLEICQLIADNPELGSKRNTVMPGLRALKKNRHVIFYIKGSGRIHIIRILHERMDVKQRF